MRSTLTALILASLAAVPGLTRADQPDPQLAERAFAVFKKYCHQCHGKDGKFEVEGFNVLDHKVLTDKESSYIVPGKPDDSEIWKRVAKNSMPPKKIAERPSDEDKASLKKWIEAGAPAVGSSPGTPTPVARKFRSEKELMSTMQEDLRRAMPQDRPYLRYFTFANLANNPAVSERDLRLYRAALSKVANSLSWENGIVIPRPVDKEQTVFAVDVRDLGWDKRDLWSELLRVYPYGMSHESDRDAEMRTLSDELTNMTRCEIPCIRADWFVNTATRPPLYHTFLDLPKTAGELEAKLGVNVQRNIERNRAARGGFANSNISAQNRMVERHPASYGAYWKSYDFKPGNHRSNLFQFPLGPKHRNNAFNQFAFEQDGGEIIFNLPNGLQGYLLIDTRDRRIDAGPTDVVGDSTKASGTTVIITGLSCMTCHNTGMKPFKDSVRNGLAVLGEARLKGEQLYRDPKQMDPLVKQDEERFVKALDQATGGFLKIGADKDKDIRKFDEPVRSLADFYQRDLGPVEVACELDYADPKTLQEIIRTNRELKTLGMGPLVEGNAIKREDWEKIKATSLYQDVARKLDKGTPKFGALPR